MCDFRALKEVTMDKDEKKRLPGEVSADQFIDGIRVSANEDSEGEGGTFVFITDQEEVWKLLDWMTGPEAREMNRKLRDKKSK